MLKNSRVIPGRPDRAGQSPRPGMTMFPAFFRILLSCSLSRFRAQLFVALRRRGSLLGAHRRRQNPKTPVEQALMRGLDTA